MCNFLNLYDTAVDLSGKCTLNCRYAYWSANSEACKYAKYEIHPPYSFDSCLQMKQYRVHPGV